MSTDTQTPQKGETKFNALGAAGYLIVLAVAISGWSLSFRQLHAWGMDALGETYRAAWLIPMTYDLAPLGLSIVVYQMRRRGRSAITWRAGIWAFTALSATINYLHAPDFQYAQYIAPLLPISAVVLFEGLMAEVYHKAMERIYGTGVVPRLTLVCWLLDTRRTFKAFRVKALRPLSAAEKALGMSDLVLPNVEVETPPVADLLVASAQNTNGHKPSAVKAPRKTFVDMAEARRVVDENPGIDGEKLGAELGVSRATGYRTLRKINNNPQPV